MNFERLTDPSHPLFSRAAVLYSVSFPPHEQREEQSQLRILGDSDYHFDLIFDGGDFVGIILYWKAEGFTYVEHFCILPEKRGSGCGSRALELLLRQNERVVLEIDPPTDGTALRRKGFYERCGFKANAFEHVHPPYHKGNAGHALVLMSAPNKMSEADFRAFTAYLRDRVMRDAY